MPHRLARKRNVTLALILAGCALLTGDVWGSTMVVDFGGDYVERVSGVNRVLRGGELLSNQTVDVDGDGSTANDVVSYFDFSRIVPLSPIGRDVDPTRFDYDTTQRSAVFYGGAASFFANAPDTAIPEAGAIVDHFWPGKTDHTADDIGLRGGNSQSSPSDVSLRHHSVFLWQQDGFTAGTGPGESIEIDKDSLMSLTVSRKWHGLEEVRMVIGQGGQLYMSEAWTDFPEANVQPWGITEPATFDLAPASTQWVPYDPSGFDMAFDSSTTFLPMSFDDVDTFGFYFGKDTLSAELTWVTFSDFEVSAVLIPEPATGLLVVAGALGLVGRRRNGLGRRRRFIFDRGPGAAQ